MKHLKSSSAIGASRVNTPNNRQAINLMVRSHYPTPTLVVRKCSYCTETDTIQINIGLYPHLSVSVSVPVSDSVYTPLPETEASHTAHSDGRTLVQRVSQNQNGRFQGRHGFLPIKLETHLVLHK